MSQDQWPEASIPQKRNFVTIILLTAENASICALFGLPAGGGNEAIPPIFHNRIFVFVLSNLTKISIPVLRVVTRFCDQFPCEPYFRSLQSPHRLSCCFRETSSYDCAVECHF